MWSPLFTHGVWYLNPRRCWFHQDTQQGRKHCRECAVFAADHEIRVGIDAYNWFGIRHRVVAGNVMLQIPLADFKLLQRLGPVVRAIDWSQVAGQTTTTDEGGDSMREDYASTDS